MASESSGDRHVEYGPSAETVTIRPELYERIEDRLKRSPFDTVDEYVTFVLEEVLVRVEESTPDDEAVVDRNEVESRLEALGYLD